MFLRATTRKKDGKDHRYWSIVENKRLSGGRVLQRHVLYLGEINSSPEQVGVNPSKCSKTVWRRRARCRCFPMTGRR